MAEKDGVISRGRDLGEFLRSRGINAEVIKLLEDDKIDKHVILLLDDFELSKYIPKYGDRVAVKAFCRETTLPTTRSKKESLLDQLREKIEMKKRQSPKSQPEDKRCQRTRTNSTKATRRIDLGLFAYDELSEKYKQMRPERGGGTRSIIVDKNLTGADLRQQAIDIFFPGGEATIGSAIDFRFSLSLDFSRKPFPDDMTVMDAYESSKMKLLRCYLCADKIKEMKVSEQNENSDSDFESLPPCPFSLQDSTSLEKQSAVLEMDCINEGPLEHHNRESRQSSCKELGEDELPELSTEVSGVLNPRPFSYAAYVAATCEEGDEDYEEEEDVDFQETILESLNDSQLQIVKTLEETLQPIRPTFDDSDDTTPDIVIRRSNVWTSTLREIKTNSIRFDRPFRVVFSGEEAEDQGGPRREFFRLLMIELLTSSGCFTGSKGHITFSTNLLCLREERYRLVGKLIRWSLSWGGPGFPVFSEAFFSLLIKRKPSTEQLLMDVDFLSDHIKQLRDADSLETFTTFVVQHGDVLADLGLYGNQLKLDNRLALLESLVENEIFHKSASAIEQFKSGLGDLYTIIERNALTCKELLVDCKPPMTYHSFRQLYTIEKSSMGSNNRLAEEDTIYAWELFLKGLNNATEEDPVNYSRLLEFWTGANRIPAIGFESMMTVDFFTPKLNERRLPFSSTCGMVINLPRGVDPNTLEAMMTTAITECAGFGKL